MSQESGLVDEESINEFAPFTELEKIICNYIFNKDLDGSEVLANMKYEYSDRAAFFSLLPNQWISSRIINLTICMMTLEEKKCGELYAWHLPTHFSQKMIEEDGNPTLEWFKRTYRDDDKYMSRLKCCEQVKGLDKLLSYLEKDNYTNSITKFPLKSPLLDPIQSNGYDCGMYVIKHMHTKIIKQNLTLMESWSERIRYKLASNLVLSMENEQRSKIIENARNTPLQDIFRSLE
ncbi:uncharacterized protein LOC115958935 isoform X4 [Quercus lobata]|uniref:uncharacterized protein LOC115958935 isoform X4 n=1 Tax=Quercus lobata TaxID=97700 RepID=UPI0012442F8B|nr:uncharacterized protein LOC115958935 isoform X4 [Quercus lobata]